MERTRIIWVDIADELIPEEVLKEFFYRVNREAQVNNG